MSYLFILLSFLFVAQPGDPEPNGLSISITSEVELPADQIQFNINLNAEAESPQAAYKLHQQREDALVKLLDTYDIKEKDIRYQPISISKVRNYNNDSEKEPVYHTQQAVQVTLKDFDVYEKIQIGLIEHDFDDFSGAFTSTDFENGKDEALKKAIREAKAKAKLIADEAGVSLGHILDINYSYNQVRPYAQQSAALKTSADSGSLLKYNQTVTVSASVSMRFAFDQ